jgi:dolichyl-phosphate-mannose-protein mannosyltransferase
VLPDAEKVNYKLPGFFGKFIELQQVMWTTNAGLTDRHVFDSSLIVGRTFVVEL